MKYLEATDIRKAIREFPREVRWTTLSLNDMFERWYQLPLCEDITILERVPAIPDGRWEVVGQA